MKHTPGPWEWRIKKEILVDPKDKEFGFFVGDLEHSTGEKSGSLVITTEENRYGQKEIICFSNADKNLIEIAPELLEALKGIRPYIEDDLKAVHADKEYIKAISVVIEAIDKADGK